MTGAAPVAPAAYDPSRCGLCGSTAAHVLVDRPGRAFTSDSRIVDGGLRKIACEACGLVRDGHPFDPAALRDHYHAYTLAVDADAAEPIFFTADGPRPRSAVVANWIADSAEAVLGRAPSSVMEIGCGEGLVIERLRGRWPMAALAGVDLSPAAVALARARGVNAREGGSDSVDGAYDVIYAFAVLEHVPSPADFLASLRAHLAPGGVLVVAQPCQDRGSNDVFFCDHLHHFYSRHVGELGRRAGLVERLRRVGHDVIPDFSLHVFAERGTMIDEPAAAAVAGVPSTIARWEAIFGRVDAWLDQEPGAPVAVWGLGQTFQLWRAYTRLGDVGVAEGLDDNPARFAGRVPFPVRTLDASAVKGARLLLTFAPGAPVVARLAAAGRTFCAPLGEPTP